MKTLEEKIVITILGVMYLSVILNIIINGIIVTV
jgi:hypothetical protein